jgi:pilus assembly protein FimV
MKRKLTLAMLLSFSTTSPTVLALGLGEVEVRSSLNAPLRASIPLTDTDGLQPGLLNVTMAGERGFSAAGLDRTPLAASVRLAVEERDGRLMLDMTSERPVRQPWLDLLLRFDWPGGQQLREVTLLLDPPDYDQMPALIAGSSGRATPPRSQAGTGDDTQGSPAPEDATANAPRPSREGDAGDPAWVRSGDTLWAVAGRLRPDSDISMDQVMVSLVEANPEVFPSGNINAMRAGFTLVVPSRDAMASRSGGEAQRLVQSMNQAWANRGGGAPARVPLGGDEAPAAAVASAPQLEDAGDATAETAVDAEPAAALAEEQEGEGQRLTLLTDAEVAAEQASLEAEAGDGEGGGGGSRVRIDPEVLERLHGGGGELTSDERLVRLEARWQESREALEEVRGERDRLQQDLGEMRAELDALRDRVAVLTAGGEGEDGPGAGGLVAADGGDASGDTPWWGAVVEGGSDRQLMLGGAGLAALLGLWLLLRQRRRRDDGDATTFGRVQVVGPGMDEVVTPSGATPPGGESPSPTALRASMPQAEAINEADIFIAYGRYDQARELLEASLEQDPHRDDLRLKLLMVYRELGQEELADREAERLRDSEDPAIHDEVARLMQVTARPAEPEPPPSFDDERAVFAEPAELPPRHFDQDPVPDSVSPSEVAEPASAPQPEPASPEAPSGAAGAGAPPPEDTSQRFRPPRQDDLQPQAGRPASEPTPPEPNAADGEPDRPFVAPVDAPLSDLDPPPAEARTAEALDIPPTRDDGDGGDIIDYRPPTLEPNPGPREETPMQPSVEFTPSGGGDSPAETADLDDGPPRSDPVSDDWEVEEVAFPPLNPDNISTPGESSSLSEVRRLLEAGEHDRARALLEPLAEDADPTTREEARSLLTRLIP